MVRTTNLCVSLLFLWPSPSKLYRRFIALTYTCCVFGILIFHATRLVKIFVTSFTTVFFLLPVSYPYNFSLHHCAFFWRFVLCVRTTTAVLGTGAAEGKLVDANSMVIRTLTLPLNWVGLPFKYGAKKRGRRDVGAALLTSASLCLSFEMNVILFTVAS